jgi:hypothetical protein
MSGRRHAVLLLVSSLLLAGIALLAWGPLPLGAHAHEYADGRTWLGVPNAANVLVNLPLFWLAVWGWCVTRLSAWPRALRLPWQGFHLWVMVTSLASAMYHAAPTDALLVVSRTCQACAFGLLILGLLAERVSPRFGSGGACVAASVVVLLAGLMIVYSGRQAHGGVDLRPLVLLELVPIILIPVALLRLASDQGRLAGWLLALAVYAAARVAGLADTSIFSVTGWVSGHTVMHFGCGVIVGWMGYRAAGSRVSDIGSGAAVSALSQRRTSANTTG